MSIATLKKTLGEGGAFFDDSSGEDNLYDVLKALAEGHSDLDAYQAAAATAVIASKIIDKPTRLHSFRLNVAVAGTAGQTDVDLVVNGDVIATLTVDNADADGTSVESEAAALPLDLAEGDLVQLEVSAAATDATGVTASCRISGVTPQP